MGIIIGSLLEIATMILNFLYWSVILNVIINWLVAFNILNTHNTIVDRIVDITYRITEPFLKPIRRIIPTLGGIDISPFVFIFIIFLLRRAIFGLAVFGIMHTI